MGKKKTTLLKPILFFGVVLMTLILVVVSFTYSWFTSNEEVVYPFEISADGVLYVYVDADVQENPTSLIPAVTMEGAVAEGLPMNVLKTYAEDSNSYIKSAASITDVTGRFTVFNDGVGYDRVELPKDADGYTLYPKIETSGNIVWKSDNHTPGNWETHRIFVREELVPIIDPSTGEQMKDEYGYLWDIVNIYSTETDYYPLIDEDGGIVWKEGFTPAEGADAWDYYGEDFWECEMVETEGAAEAEVTYNIFFKSSDDPEAQDYLDPDLFTIKRIYFTSTPDAVTEEDMATASTIFPITPSTADLKQGKFTIKGTQPLFLHAEIYLTYPDELLGDSLRGKPIYMALAVSVSLQVEIPDYMVE